MTLSSPTLGKNSKYIKLQRFLLCSWVYRLFFYFFFWKWRRRSGGWGHVRVFFRGRAVFWLAQSTAARVHTCPLPLETVWRASAADSLSPERRQSDDAKFFKIYNNTHKKIRYLDCLDGVLEVIESILRNLFLLSLSHARTHIPQASLTLTLTCPHRNTEENTDKYKFYKYGVELTINDSSLERTCFSHFWSWTCR